VKAPNDSKRLITAVFLGMSISSVPKAVAEGSLLIAVFLGLGCIGLTISLLKKQGEA
jgi:hypothetical protein